MKRKLNQNEARILASRMLKSEINGAVERAQNSPQIKSKVVTSNKLLKAWLKAEQKSKQEEHAFKKFLEDNKVLIERGFGNIILKYDENWNQQTREWDKTIEVDVSSSSHVEEKIQEEIIIQQIESETLDELQVNVREAIMNKSQRLLT
jgi:hypothetical protein